MKASVRPRDIYSSFIHGDSLTNEQVEVGKEFFKDLADKLLLCGPEFRLAFKEANTVAMRLEEFSNARKSKNGQTT